jgi:hypothetical protein
MHPSSTISGALRRPPYRSHALGAVLVLALTTLIAAPDCWASADAGRNVHGGPPAHAAASEGIVPDFKMQIAGERPRGGGPERVHLIVISGTANGESVAISCGDCRGGRAFGPLPARAAEVTFSPPHLVVTDRSRLVVDVTANGMVGRYSEYEALNSGLGHRKLVQTGCLAPGGTAHVSCSLATQTELGVTPTSAATGPSCPGSPCLAVSRTTGFQVGAGASENTFTAPHGGSVVAWTITLGTPAMNQIAFFDASEGGAAEAGIAVLRPESGPESTYSLVALSPTVKLAPYFGTTHKFPLARALPVEGGDVVALSVPTWAPALALGLGNETTWRSSRQSGQCTSTSVQSAQMVIGSSLQYGCVYGTARLTYSATLSSIP